MNFAFLDNSIAEFTQETTDALVGVLLISLILLVYIPLIGEGFGNMVLGH